MQATLITILAVCIVAFISSLLYARSRRVKGQIGFLHPNSGGGGGGERVLWVALKALQESPTNPRLVLYSRRYGGGNTHEEQKRALLNRVKEQFGIEIADTLRIVFMSDRSVEYLDPRNYPRLTLLRQTFWSGIYMFLEVGVKSRPPSILVESVGIPFTYPLLNIFSGVRIIPYTHYPIISTDMVARVASGTSSFNNNASISKSIVLTLIKLYYYRVFAWLYWFCGQFVENPIANSSWTADHIEYMWGRRPTIIYPPCNVENLLQASESSSTNARNNNLIVSVGQFRPEKNHQLQLEAFKEALPLLPKGTQLVLAGGARGEDDLARVRSLEKAAVALGLEIGKDVVFKVSRPYSEITDLLTQATVGLHTMTDEHFGIVVVEYQAAGALALAHNSAGPKRDIILSDKAGRLATTREEFAKALVALFSLSDDEKAEMRFQARKDVRRFTDEEFSQRIKGHVLGLKQLGA